MGKGGGGAGDVGDVENADPRRACLKKARRSLILDSTWLSFGTWFGQMR